MRRVEIAPHYDLWMRGARTGAVVSSKRNKDGKEILSIRMDHPQVKKLVKIPNDDVTDI